MIRFYAPDIESRLMLPESDSQHCVKVLRRSVGDDLEVVDGRGGVFTCRIVDAHPKHVAVDIIEKRVEVKAWPQRIVVAVAPTKHLDRMEWLIEKLVEVGIDEFVPVRGNRSERREIKPERLERIAVSAMKQSLKASLPVISPMVSLSDFAARPDILSCSRFFGYCDEKTERRELAKVYRPGADVALLIGPEGDFDPAEVTALTAGGWLPVTFGNTRLRTETAALFAAIAIHVITNRND